MSLKRLLSLVFACGMVGAMLVGCSGGGVSGNSRSGSAENDGASASSSLSETSSDSSSSASGLAASNSSAAQSGDDQLVVSLAEAKRIFSCTLEGKSYSFPCPASELTAAGWEYGSRNSSDADKLFDPGRGLDGAYLTLGDVNQYGWADKQVQISFMNMSDSPAKWDECTLLGMRTSQEDSDDPADFDAGIGINIGDSADKVIEKFGHWNSSNESSSSSSTFQIVVEDEGDAKKVGYVSFNQKDGMINEVYIDASYVYIDMLR